MASFLSYFLSFALVSAACALPPESHPIYYDVDDCEACENNEFHDDDATDPKCRPRSGTLNNPDFVNTICPKSMARPLNPLKRVVLFLYQGNSDLSKSISESRDATFRQEDADLSVRQCGFDSNKPTIISMGGLTQRNDHPYLKRVRRNYDQLKAARGGDSPINLFLFDWASNSRYALAILPWYGNTVGGVEHLGKLLANFIEQLIVRHNYSPGRIQLLAHSLSSHFCGLASRRLDQKGLGRVDQITVIDPNGVCFHNLTWAFGDQFGLRGTDAKLVLASHYNMDGFGSKRPIDGVDIFVNGGKNQPEMDPAFTEDYNYIDSITTLFGFGDHCVALRHDAWVAIPTDCHDVAYRCATSSGRVPSSTKSTST